MFNPPEQRLGSCLGEPQPTGRALQNGLLGCQRPGPADHLPMADAGRCCLPEALPTQLSLAPWMSAQGAWWGVGSRLHDLSTHTIKQGSKTTCPISEPPHSIWLVEGQALGPILSLSRSSCVILNTSVDLSGPRLDVHKKGFVWLCGLQNVPALQSMSWGQGMVFMSLVCSAHWHLLSPIQDVAPAVWGIWCYCHGRSEQSCHLSKLKEQSAGRPSTVCPS